MCLKLIVCSQVEELSKKNKKWNLFLLSKHHCCARQLASCFLYIVSCKSYKSTIILICVIYVPLKDEEIKTN